MTDVDYNVFALPTPDGFARKVTNNHYETVSHHTAHAYGAYYTSGMEGKTMTITYDGGGDTSVMKIFLCDEGKMTLLHSFPMSSYGSLSHVWDSVHLQLWVTIFLVREFGKCVRMKVNLWVWQPMVITIKEFTMN